MELAHLNMVNHVYYRAVVEIDDRVKSACAQADCNGDHPIGLSVKRAAYDDHLKALIEETFVKEGLDAWIEERLTNALDERDQLDQFIRSVVGDDIGSRVDGQFRDMVFRSLNPIRNLMDTNPGVVGVWMYCMRYGRRRRNVYYGKGPYAEWPSIEHEGVAVRLVSEATGLKPGTRAWKRLLKMPSAEVYACLQRISRKRENADNEVAVLSAALNIESAIDGKVNGRAMRRVEAALMDRFRRAESFRPLFHEFLRQSALPAKQRGFTLNQLNREFTIILDWADNEIYGAVLSREKWGGFRKTSAKWHRHKDEQAREMERLLVIKKGPNLKAWDSLLEEYACEYKCLKYIVIPLLNEVDLTLESTRAGNCVGNGNYANRCHIGVRRIFSIQRVASENAAGRKMAHAATVELEKDGTSGRWSMKHAEGSRRSKLSSSAKEIIRDLTERYHAASLASDAEQRNCA